MTINPDLVTTLRARLLYMAVRARGSLQTTFSKGSLAKLLELSPDEFDSDSAFKDTLLRVCARIPHDKCDCTVRATEVEIFQFIPGNADAITRVFDAWVTATNKPKTRLTPERESLIGKRITEHGEKLITEAVKGVAFSQWHMGDNPSRTRYDDLTLVLRDDKQIEKFSALFRDNRKRPNPQSLNEADRLFAEN